MNAAATDDEADGDDDDVLPRQLSEGLQGGDSGRGGGADHDEVMQRVVNEAVFSAVGPLLDHPGYVLAVEASSDSRRTAQVDRLRRSPRDITGPGPGKAIDRFIELNKLAASG